MLPDNWLAALHATPSVWHAPASAQIEATGPPSALVLRVAATLGDLRLEAQPMLDLPAQSWHGSLALRHPGAPRLLAALGWPGAVAWLGDGSLSLVTQLAVGGGRVTGDHFDLIAGALHAAGTLALQGSATGNVVSGNLAVETLPLPPLPATAAEPLTLPVLAGWRADVKLEAGAILLGQTPVATRAAATLGIADNVLRLTGFTATAFGGALTGQAHIDLAASPPAVALQATLAGAVVPGAVFATPFDLAAGVMDATASLTAAGYSPAGMLATLAGDASLAVKDGVFTGVDLAKAIAPLSDAEIRAALEGGSTAFERLNATAHVERGTVTLTHAELTGNAGTITMSGQVELPADTVDLRLGLRPLVPDPPEIGLRVTGAPDAPRRSPETSEVIRWRAEHTAER